MKCCLPGVFPKSYKIKIKLGFQFLLSNHCSAFNAKLGLPEAIKNGSVWCELILTGRKLRWPHYIKPGRINGFKIVANIGYNRSIELETVFHLRLRVGRKEKEKNRNEK